ncbi:undecaprenyl-diphosphate phosphatase [Magnetovibrio blakemorei]|uniref:Undecaprenyl-diphosphatase n=1 Tax=Magnetovibrio blakemorei TaxID=28181 RepID=A0A1E5QBE3_9PROT|nr:undecaprenyl-diphosphate phosphatase [Magnetovibrio blakemorei]OEJ69287.1 undecaprenyl-diphosphatase [Magnetovibrio blakemorei]
MPLFHIVILALVQGVTEFLPISSSAHLILTPRFFDWQDQGLILDVAVHVGTLGAVMAYLWRDVLDMFIGLWRMVLGKGINAGARLAFFVVLGTIPVIIAGYAMNKVMPDGIRSIEVIGWATLGFGVLLWVMDRFSVTLRTMEHLKLSDVVLIGLSQCLALIPGTSRSGITMTTGRFLGMERSDCARFSMLLSIPAIVGAGTLKGLELYKTGDALQISTALTGVGLSFVSALIAIALMMAWLKRASFTPFVIYRLGLGCVLLAVSYGYL